MHHLLVHMNQDKTKIMTQQYMQLNIGGKEIQQLNLFWKLNLKVSHEN